MVHLLESKGVRVFWIRHESPSLDAFSFWRETKVFVVLNLLKDAGDRARFDAAHELGHLVLHRHLEAQTMGGKAIEKEADRFAAAFLLPAESFTEECPEYPDLGRLYALKARWKVSVAAMIMRGSQLGLFSEWQTRQAFKKMNALGMLRTEKVRIQREQSRLHKMIFSALADKNVSPAAYASSLHLNLTELEELMPIAREFVQQKQEQSVTVPRALNTPRVHLRVIRGGKENRAVN